MTTVKLTSEAEKAGWDGVFIWDMIDGIDSWVVLAAIAVGTSTPKDHKENQTSGHNIR